MIKGRPKINLNAFSFDKFLFNTIALGLFINNFQSAHCLAQFICAFDALMFWTNVLWWTKKPLLLIVRISHSEQIASFLSFGHRATTSFRLIARSVFLCDEPCRKCEHYQMRSWGQCARQTVVCQTWQGSDLSICLY